MKNATLWVINMCLFCTSFNVLADNIDTSLLDKGRYLATAADCTACHTQPNSQAKPYAGNYAIHSPMGDIIASNITPSAEFGIGNYTEQQFSDALRKGIAADGHHLYPAMPYTAYSGMTDEDVHALYYYFMHGVEPVDEPAKQTELDFPFNIRALMFGWNLLYANDQPYTPDDTQSAELSRGQYLSDVLGHCSTCHTPRNSLMAEDQSQYLAGAELDGWYAPNITSDAESGIGNWSYQDIAQYLKTGDVPGKAQAGGPMAEAIEHSFRHLNDGDLNAIAKYIKQVPAIQTPVAKALTKPVTSSVHQQITGQGDQASLADTSEQDGGRLYQNACASCHGRDGAGTDDHFYPSLVENRTVTAAKANNLIMAISDGVARQGNQYDVLMPAFKRDLSNQQIASVTNYVRQRFGQVKSDLSSQDVAAIRHGQEAPFVIRYASTLLVSALVLVLIVIGVVVVYRRRK